MAKLFALFAVCLVAASNAAPQSRPELPPGGGGGNSSSTTTSRPSPSIILGEPAQEGEIPFQALLFSSQTGADFGFQCGGSLIAPNWIVTAAHCLTETDGTDVSMGSVDRNAMPFSEYSTQRYSHESYNLQGNHENDIALIKLANPPPTGQNIAIVDMATANLGTQEGEVARASGWGLTTDMGMVSEILMKVNLNVIPNQQCNDYYRTITEGQICTVYSTQVGESTCQGDSGGPLSFDDAGTTYLIGITSFGSAAGCDADVPSAYTRISAYRDWIQQTMDANP